MPHAHHFLERLDRVKRAHTEYALELYRDHEGVKYVLDRVSLPPDADRAALAIHDGGDGPWVIVTRDGHFVTCLGEGMSTGRAPVVPRAQIDSLRAKLDEKRARREIAQRELRPHEEEDDLFHRIVIRGERMAREDFLAVSAFDAILGLEPYLMMIDLSADMVLERGAMLRIKKNVNHKTFKALERHDRLTWAVAHFTLLSGAAERRDLDALLRAAQKAGQTPSYMCTVHQGTTFALRGAWLAARLGKGVLSVYRQRLETATDLVAMLDAAMGIAAIGLRHASVLGDAKRILQTVGAENEADLTGTPQLGRAFVSKWLLQMLDQVDKSIEATIAIARDVTVVKGQNLPQGHPYRFEKPEDVPESLARTTALTFDGDLLNSDIETFTVHAVPVAARAAPEDFYYPRDVVRAWDGTWDPDETLQRLERFRPKTRGEPVRAAPVPGRNDPCPCGSGKKWKKCHGLSDAGGMQSPESGA